MVKPTTATEKKTAQDNKTAIKPEIKSKVKVPILRTKEDIHAAIEELLETNRQIKVLTEKKEEMKEIIEATLDKEGLERWEDNFVVAQFVNTTTASRADLEALRKDGMTKYIIAGQPTRVLRTSRK